MSFISILAIVGVIPSLYVIFLTNMDRFKEFKEKGTTYKANEITLLSWICVITIVNVYFCEAYPGTGFGVFSEVLQVILCSLLYTLNVFIVSLATIEFKERKLNEN